MPAGPVAQHFRLQSGLAVLGRRDMVDHCLDLAAVENAILTARFKVGNGNRRGDFMAENTVETKNLRSGKRLVPQMCGEYFFGYIFFP